jgi:hypothetical protein
MPVRSGNQRTLSNDSKENFHGAVLPADQIRKLPIIQRKSTRGSQTTTDSGDESLRVRAELVSGHSTLSEVGFRKLRPNYHLGTGADVRLSWANNGVANVKDFVEDETIDMYRCSIALHYTKQGIRRSTGPIDDCFTEETFMAMFVKFGFAMSKVKNPRGELERILVRCMRCIF